MNKEKQIEEMAVEFAKINCNQKGCYSCNLCDEYGSLELNCEDYLHYRTMAETFYNAGYRKASEVAEEIFAEIEENLNNLIRYYKEKRKYVTEVEYSELEQRYCDIKIKTFEERLLKIAKLKKKYTEGEG